MKNDEMLWVVGGGLVLWYLITQSSGQQAAAAQIAATNLQAGTNVTNAGLIANAATSVGNDLSFLASEF